MTDQPRPWGRLFLEGAVIVGSILLAFGIDAAWDNVQERRTEREFLEALERDLVVNQAELARVQTSMQRSSAASDVFLSSSAAELAALPADSARILLIGLGSAVAFTAFKGNLDRGDLSIVRRQDLRARLANWLGYAEDLAENAPRDLDALRQLTLRAGAGSLGLFGSDPGPAAGSATLARLRSDAEFLSLLEWQQALRRVTIREAAEVDELTSEILSQIRSEVRGSS